MKVLARARARQVLPVPRVQRRLHAIRLRHPRPLALFDVGRLELAAAPQLDERLDGDDLPRRDAPIRAALHGRDRRMDEVDHLFREEQRRPARGPRQVLPVSRRLLPTGSVKVQRAAGEQPLSA
jgi:hypothetical protein